MLFFVSAAAGYRRLKKSLNLIDQALSSHPRVQFHRGNKLSMRPSMTVKIVLIGVLTPDNDD